MEFVSPEGLRLDGRRPKELRRLNCQLDVLANADGSAILEMGNTKVRDVCVTDAMQSCRAIHAPRPPTSRPVFQVLASGFGFLTTVSHQRGAW